MENFNFTKKELKGSYVYSTIDNDRDDVIDFLYKGRLYRKHGTYQSVTAIGNVYEDDSDRMCMCIGITKQNPSDRICDKDIAIENAMENALIKPSIVIYDIPEHFDEESFNALIDLYVNNMKLSFIKTNAEIHDHSDKKYID